MTINRLFVVAVMATSMLAGCASRPRQPLPDEGYTKFSVLYIEVSKCGASGYIDPELASFGLSQMRSFLSDYSYDPALMEESFKNRQSIITVTQEECNKIAMNIHDAKRRVATNQQNSAAQQQQLQTILNNSPKQTYCNKFGTQVMCSTY